MRLFQRIGDIIAANLNDLVDRFEDPEVMLKASHPRDGDDDRRCHRRCCPRHRR